VRNFLLRRCGFRAQALWASAALVLAVVLSAPVRADSPQAIASGLSDSAFAMLNSIDADAKTGGAMLAPVASLASDAQSLSAALDKGDRAGAGHAMAAVVRDRNQIDAARAANGAPYLAQWNSIKGQIAALEAQVTPVAGSVATSAPAASSPAAPSASLPPEAKAPQVVINSRSFSGGGVRVRGFFEGTDLKSAGIFDGSVPVKTIRVSDVTGEQRVNFDFGIQDPSPSQMIEVTDSLGRVARAQVAPDAAALTHSHDGHEKMIELGAGGAMDSDALASSGPVAVPPSRNNTEEIPRADGSESASGAPGRRIPGGVEGPLINVQINVLGVMPSPSQPGSYEVIGQITGAGVHRAGVYVNGRPMKPIPIGAGGYNSFDVTFQMPPGQQASIRAYGMGSNFVEASVDASNDGMSTASAPPIMIPGMNPYGSAYGYGSPYGAPVYPGGYPPGYGAPGYGVPGYGAPGYGYPAPGYGYPPGYAPPGTAMPWYRRLIP